MAIKTHGPELEVRARGDAGRDRAVAKLEVVGQRDELGDHMTSGQLGIPAPWPVMINTQEAHRDIKAVT